MTMRAKANPMTFPRARHRALGVPPRAPRHVAANMVSERLNDSTRLRRLDTNFA